MLDKKIPPPIIMLVAGWLMWLVAQITPRISDEGSLHWMIALVVASLGAGLDLASLYYFRRSRTTINPLNPEATTAIVNGGPYRFSRNPMYLGLLCLLIAWAFYLRSLPSLVVILGFVVYITHFQIKPEENILKEKFGARYLEYQQHVRRWI